MKKIVLYGTGLEGEKFYSRISNPNGISYCIDKRNHRYFHNKYVYSLDEKIDELKECYTVIAAAYQTFLEIRDTLIENGLNEFWILSIASFMKSQNWQLFMEIAIWKSCVNICD